MGIIQIYALKDCHFYELKQADFILRVRLAFPLKLMLTVMEAASVRRQDYGSERDEGSEGRHRGMHAQG